MSFDPTKHLMKLQGRDYLPVNARIAWLNDQHTSFEITTMLNTDAGHVIATASVRILKDDGTLLKAATATKTAKEGSFKGGTHEKVETGAIGRALGLLGYGTLQTDDFDEEPETMGGIADSPVPARAAPPARTSKLGPALTATETDAAGLPDPNDYDHAGVPDDELFSEGKVKLLYVVGGKLFELRGDALDHRLCKAATSILKRNVHDLHALHWKDGTAVLDAVKTEAIKLGKFQERAA